MLVVYKSLLCVLIGDILYIILYMSLLRPNTMCHTTWLLVTVLLGVSEVDISAQGKLSADILLLNKIDAMLLSSNSEYVHYCHDNVVLA